MRILILGAGGIGGYFGGRLAAGGADVTFLVRPRRAEQLQRNGLVIQSPFGDATVPVKTVQREQLEPGWDAIILACKAFDLDEAIATLRPAAGGALIVPQLNGMRHLDALDAAFQFPLRHKAVVSVIPGGQGVGEMRSNLAASQAVIPAAFWAEMKAAGLMRPDAPVE